MTTITFQRRPLLSRLWRSYRGFRRAGIGMFKAVRGAWIVSTTTQGGERA